LKDHPTIHLPLRSGRSFLRSRALSAGVLALGLMLGGTVAGFGLPAVASTPLRAQGVPQAPLSTGEKTTPAANVPEKKEEVEDTNYQYTHSPAVVKLGSMLGMKPDAAATVFTVFNFLIMVAALGFLLLKTLPKTFRNRNTKIQKNLVDARTATEEATARLNSVEARLSKLDDQIAQMRSQAHEDNAREEQRLKASIEDEKAKILAAAEAEIQNATTLARREIQRYAAELAIEQAVRKLVVSVETDRLLVEGFAHRLGASADGDKGSEN
jgi:F-type H+-transporting ATPase subunit b